MYAAIKNLASCSCDQQLGFCGPKNYNPTENVQQLINIIIEIIKYSTVKTITIK